MHATTMDRDRGDESDRMGAETGYMEFNAPNLVFLHWLDGSSMRDCIGPYDSRYLNPRYARRMSIHTRGLDDRGRPKKTCLLKVLGEHECFRFDDRNLLHKYQEIGVFDVRNVDDDLQFHIQIRE